MVGLGSMVEALGGKLASWRELRGMSQAELGIMVGVSPNYVSEIERGTREGVSVGLLLKMADALDARVTLVGKTEGDVREQDSKLILPLRRLLLPTAHAGDSIDERELTFAKLRQKVVDGTKDFNRARYAKLTADLPGLVTSIEAAVGLHEGEAKDNLNRLMAHAYILTAQTIMHLRDESLACEAVRRAMGAAEDAGDPILRASAGENYTWAFDRQGMHDDAISVAVDMASEIEPSRTKATPEHLAVWGRILRLGSRAAAHDNRPDTAEELLRSAHGAAVQIDNSGRRLDYGRYWAVFNSTMVGITRAENALVGGDADLALRIGRDVRQTENLHLDTWLSHLCRIAVAQTVTHDKVRAIETLKSIRQLAPEWIKNSRDAHDAVIQLLGKASSRRARSSGLAELATFMGVQP